MTAVDTKHQMQPTVVAADEWLAARKELLAREKAFTRARDELSAAGRALPWLEPRYNFGTLPFGVEEAPGITVFARDEANKVYRTYSCYARGLDMLNPAYHLLDLTPRGRDEDGLGFPMAWVRLHDSYGE